MNIFVGNLAYQVADEDLRAAFAAFGQVTSASVIMDRMTGKSRGFG
ncbi:MAG: RNA-binding protein, partial [Verrucomicrobia bacterium]|nr:RNA-binding protein [Verrucomicrobiota bacterium]